MLELIFHTVFAVTLKKWHIDVEKSYDLFDNMRHYQ